MIDDHVFPILPVSTNVVYQLLHINKHLFEEGIGLRLLLDYYFVLRTLHIEQSSLADRTQGVVQRTEGMSIEKEGQFLLNEIMQAGNFGKYDDRIKHGGSQFSHAIEKTKHNLRLLTHYPEEVICEPFFRVYHWIWRRFELWRY